MIQYKNMRIKEYKEYKRKFMKYFTGRTWLDHPSEKINAGDIEKLRECGIDVVSFEAIITKYGIKGFENYKSKNRENNQKETGEQ